MTADLLLALDLGTTGVRALAVEADGTVRSRSYRPLATSCPAPGRVEQDPEEMWDASVAVLRAALREARAEARDVAAIGVASQRATAIAWDAAAGSPLAPAIGWQDRRTTARVAELRAQGIPITTLPSATKFEWLVRGVGAVREAAASRRLRLGTPDAWLGFRLTGGDLHATDPGQASCTGLFDLRRGGWSENGAAFFSLEVGALPRIAPTSAALGESRADLLGAPVAVAARAGDQQAACFAQGVRAPGDGNLTLGTAAILDVHTGAAPPRRAGGAFPIALWRLEDGGDAFCREGTVVTAGAVVDWLANLGVLPDASALDRVAGSVENAQDVAFVPSLLGLGTPFEDPTARGLIVGMTRGTTGAHIARALVEGIAHRCADLCEALDFRGRPLRADGGLARSDLLIQTVADFSGLPVLRASEHETTALGAAALAGLGVGIFANSGECSALAPSATRFEPSIDEGSRTAARARFAEALARARDEEPVR